jgi:hypothetical protein
LEREKISENFTIEVMKKYFYCLFFAPTPKHKRGLKTIEVIVSRLKKGKRGEYRGKITVKAVPGTYSNPQKVQKFPTFLSEFSFGTLNICQFTSRLLLFSLFPFKKQLEMKND